MISRVAEHCFWLSRYLERAENTARILEVNQTLLLDLNLPLEQQWKPVLIISGIHDFEGPLDAESVQTHMTWAADNHCSIVASLLSARENARIIREVISADMWERVNFYHLWLQGNGARHLYDQSRSDFYNQIKRINQLVFGIGEGTMLHGEAWEFFKLGRYLERACQTARILDVKYHLASQHSPGGETEQDLAQWSAILKSCSGYEPFHKQRHGLERKIGFAVAEFLVLAPIFPRSIAFCLHACREAAHAIAGRPMTQIENDVERELAALHGWLSSAAVEDLVQADLHATLTKVVDRIHDIGEAIRRTYFDFQPEKYKQGQLSGRPVGALGAAPRGELPEPRDDDECPQAAHAQVPLRGDR